MAIGVSLIAVRIGRDAGDGAGLQVPHEHVWVPLVSPGTRLEAKLQNAT